MASTSQVVVLRLRSGGVLVVAPVTALPWPRVLGRKLRRLQEYGLHVALADPHAMARLRDELPRMLNQPITRGAMPGDPHALATALLTGVRTGRLTLMYGHAETNLRDGRAGDLSERFGAAKSTDTGAARSLPKAVGPLPPQATPLPADRLGRLRWMCLRAPTHLIAPLDRDMQEFFSEAESPLTAQLLALWSETLEAGAGFTVDAGMFAVAAWRLGEDTPLAFDSLAEAFNLMLHGGDWPTLDRAAAKLALGSGVLGPELFRQFLRRLGDRHGDGRQSVGGEGEVMGGGGKVRA